MIFPVLRSLDIWLNNISNFNIYVYYDSLLDISQTLTCSPESDVADTTTPFVVINNGTGVAITNEDYTMVNRYVLYTNPATFITTSSRIISYNSTTGEIALEDSFSIDSTETFDIVFLDTLFIETGNSFQPYRKLITTDTRVPVYLSLQTKDDSSKEKIFDYMYLIEKNFIENKKRLAIYDENDIIKGYMKCYGSINKDSKGDFSDQIQKYLMSFSIEYTQNFKQ